MSEPITCGQGLALHAALPARIADLIARLADSLDAHEPSIDTSDEAGRLEHHAYESLARQYLSIAAQLASAATEMRSYQDLPMAQHYKDVLLRPQAFQLFREYVACERELLELLRTELERDEKMVAALDRTRT